MLMADPSAYSQPFLLLLQVAERVQTEAAEAVDAARAAAKNAVAAQARAVAAEEQARTGKELAVRGFSLVAAKSPLPLAGVASKSRLRRLKSRRNAPRQRKTTRRTVRGCSTAAVHGAVNVLTQPPP